MHSRSALLCLSAESVLTVITFCLTDVPLQPPAKPEKPGKPENCDGKSLVKDFELAKDDGKSLDSLIISKKTACGQPAIARAVIEAVAQGESLCCDN